ncbi:MAG: DNA helicase UvrD, partial [Oscillospiraceae bacterium]|nr:DNA helicase UvrD [Oscillospiraceae bacterium]
ATAEGMEEERRLAFVAMTRAEKALYLTDAEGRNHDGSFRYPSRFIFNINRELLQYTSELDSGLVDEAGAFIRSSERDITAVELVAGFAVGDRIRHAVMGEGTILEIDEGKSAFVIKYDSISTPRKISFKAKLEKV